MRLCLLLTGLLILKGLLPSVSVADVYKYRTSEGTYCFTDDPGKIPKKYRPKALIDDAPSFSSMGTPSASAGAVTGRRPSRPADSDQRRKPFDGTIFLHVKDHCPYGDQAEQYLKRIGAKYQRQDYNGNSPIFQKEDGKYGSVVVIIGSETIRGFSEGAMYQAIYGDL